MKVLIVGLGSIAEKHINALRLIDKNVQLVALRFSKTSTVVPGISNIYSFSDIPNLLFDFIIICNPTSVHYDTIKKLTPFRIPMFIEKPLFDEIKDEKILNDIEEKSIPTYVACNLRFLECVQFTKEFIKNKRINEVNSYCGSYLPDWRPNRNFRDVYSANKELGGGVHIDLIHEIDYVYWFFGMPVNVRSVKTNKSTLNITAYDYANYLFEYAYFSVSIILNYYRIDSKRSLEILTDEGTVQVDLLKNEVLFNGTVVFTSVKTILNTYEDQLRFFINNVLRGKEQFNPISEAFQILKLCLEKD